MYRNFQELPIGAQFGHDLQWRKQSSRTAMHYENGVAHRWFYFRKTDLCWVKA